MKAFKAAIGVSVLAIATLVGTVIAQAPPKGHDHGLTFMATALDLTDAQVAQIKQIRTANKPENQTNREQMKSLHQQLHALVASDNFDEAKVQSVIAQVQALQASQMLAHAREMNAIYKVLNPQQKAKAVKMFGTMGFGGMHGHPGGPEGAAPLPPTQD